MPEKFNAEALAKALAPEADGKRFLWATANRGRQVLQEQLTKAGGQVDQIVVYENVDVDEPSPDVAEALAEGKIHWTTVTSSATARSLNKLYGDALGHTQFASMSPLTSAALREMGFDPAAEADPHTADGIVDAILEAESE